MGGGIALVLRGIWWRRGASLVLVLCAAVTVAGAAVGPLWGRAAQESLLARTIGDTGISDKAWIVTGSTADYGGITFPPPDPRTVIADVERESRLPPSLNSFFDGPTETVTTARRLQIRPISTTSSRDGEKLPLATLLARDGACQNVHLMQGTCPRKKHDLLLSDRSAKDLGVTRGDKVQLPELTEEPPLPPDPKVSIFRVTGIYSAETIDTTGRFWFDSDAFDYAPEATLAGETLPAHLDAIIATPDLLQSLRTVEIGVQREQALKAGVITLGNADRFATRLLDQQRTLAGTTRIVQSQATAADTVQGTSQPRTLVKDTATFVGLQVVVFGWVVLFGLVALSVAARDAELALAKLRGLRGRRLATHALAEPLTLVLVAVPLGLAAAWLAVSWLAQKVLLPNTHIAAPRDLWWAVGATAAGSALACVLAARRAVRMPVADQLRRQTPSSGTAGPVVTAVLLTLAVVGLGLVLSLGRGARAALPALLTPVVVGLAAGLVTGAAVQLLMRAAAGRTRNWPLAPYLAVRQLARQSALTRTTALVTVATAVSGFAAGAYVVTATQREAQARLDVGAERVVHVAPVATSTLLAATRRVDPGGHWAMAAVQRGEGGNALLAVDARRFGAVFAVPHGSLVGGLNQLVPSDIPKPLGVKGDTVTVAVQGSILFAEKVRVGLQLRVVTPDGVLHAYLLGPLAQRPVTLTAKVPACVKGCTIAGVYVIRTRGIGRITGALELASLSVGGRAYPFTETDWRPARLDESVPDSASTSSLQAADKGGLEVRFDASPSQTAGIVHRDVPTELPAVVADTTQLGLIGTRQLVGGVTLGGSDVPFSIVGRSPAIPRATGGSVVDLDLASRVDPPRGSTLDFQVWLGESAPSDAPGLLRKAGLRVLDVETRAQRQQQLDDAEPARAQLLLLGADGAILLAGVAGIATVLAASARRRAVESAALHAMAVPGRVVRGSAVLEDVVLLLPGIVAGALCAAYLVSVLTPVLAQVTGTAAVVAGPPAVADVALPVSVAALVTALLLVPVVLAVTRPAADETPLRAAT